MIAISRTSLTVTLCAAALLAGACSSSGGSSDMLTKAQFVAQADALCASTLAKIKTTPAPQSLSDYTAILSYDTNVLTLEPQFHQAITALAARSSDSAALHKNWIDVDYADYTAQKPLIDQIDAGARAKDPSNFTAIANQLSSLPDHSAAEASYLTSYGLTDCASLANLGNSGN